MLPAPGSVKLAKRRFSRTAVGVSLVVLLAGAQLAVGSTAKPGRAAALEKPNIVLILTDDQRWDSLTDMPIVQSELAAKGITFTNGFVTDGVCCPSRASILTGQYPHTTGVYSNHANIYGALEAFDDTSTIATWLDPDYETALIGRYLNGYAAAPADYVPPGWDTWEVFRSARYFDFTLNENGVDTVYEGPGAYSTSVLRDKAVLFIENAKGPFFLHFSTNAPHASAQPDPEHPEDLEVFAGLPRWRPPNFDEKNVTDKPAWVQAVRRLTADDKRSVRLFRRRQLTSLLAVDRAVGAIVDALEAKGVLDNTMIVFTSDNGMLYGEHRMMGKNLPYDEAIRVPYIVSYPPLTPTAREDSHLVTNIDFAPTFAELAGVTPPILVEGESLIPLLESPSALWRQGFLVEHWAGRSPPQPPRFCEYRSMTKKYVTYWRADKREYYNLLSDPYELHNLYGRTRSKRAVKRLDARLRELCVPKPPPPLAPSSPRAAYPSQIGLGLETP